MSGQYVSYDGCSVSATTVMAHTQVKRLAVILQSDCEMPQVQSRRRTSRRCLLPHDRVDSVRARRLGEWVSPGPPEHDSGEGCAGLKFDYITIAG